MRIQNVNALNINRLSRFRSLERNHVMNLVVLISKVNRMKLDESRVSDRYFRRAGITNEKLTIGPVCTS